MNKTLGQTIKDLRITKGLNQTKLGALCGVSQTTIGAWERGENSPTPENLVALANVLEVDPAVFRNADTGSTRLEVHQERVPFPRPVVEREYAPYQARKDVADKFEQAVAKYLAEANVSGRWRTIERAPTGVQWNLDYESDNAVVEFKVLDSRAQMGFQSNVTASLWRLVTLRAHLKDSRAYAVIVCSLPDEEGQPQFDSDLLGDIRMRRPTAAARLHRLQAEAALMGISIYVVSSPLEAAETIMALENPDWGYDQDEE